MSDLDAIEARSTPRSFYSADGHALLAEVRALRERVATLEGGIHEALERRKGGQEVGSTLRRCLAESALLDASHDQEQTDEGTRRM